MSRILKALLLSLILAIGIPVVLPNGAGGTYLPWQKLKNPAAAWQLQYIHEPYRELYQTATHLLNRDEEQDNIRAYQDKSGTWHISSNPTSGGKLIRSSGNSQLLRATREEAEMAMAATILFLFVVCYILLSPVTSQPPAMLENLREKKRAEEQYQHELMRKKAADAIQFSTGNPYTFLGVRDDTPTAIIRDTYLSRLAALSPEKLQRVAPAVRQDAEKEIARVEQAWALIRKHRKLDT